MPFVVILRAENGHFVNHVVGQPLAFYPFFAARRTGIGSDTTPSTVAQPAPYPTPRQDGPYGAHPIPAPARPVNRFHAASAAHRIRRPTVRTVRAV